MHPMRRAPILIALALLVTAGCGKGTAPLDIEYDGPELTAARAAGEQRNAARLATFETAAAPVHRLGSARYDVCDGGDWFPEERYYLPYDCTTHDIVAYSFGGDYAAGTRRIGAALMRIPCFEGVEGDFLRFRVETPPGGDLTRFEGAFVQCRPDRTQPGDPRLRVRWLPVRPTDEQRDTIQRYLERSCEEYCEYEQLDLSAVTAAAPAGDEWIVLITVEDTYRRGKPING